jgi:hypothetical protein
MGERLSDAHVLVDRVDDPQEFRRPRAQKCRSKTAILQSVLETHVRERLNTLIEDRKRRLRAVQRWGAAHNPEDSGPGWMKVHWLLTRIRRSHMSR